MHLRILTFFGSFSTLVGRAMVSFYLGVLMVGLMMSAALAQAGDPSSVVDIGEAVVWIIQIFGPLLASILAGLAIFLFRRLQIWLGLKIDERHRAAVEQGMVRAAGFVLARFESKATGAIPIDLRSPALAEGVRYVGTSFPGALKHFGIDVATEAGRQRAAEMLESRLEGRFLDPAAADASGAPRMLSASLGPVPA